jgi:hypothetical protein
MGWAVADESFIYDRAAMPEVGIRKRLISTSEKGLFLEVNNP